MLKSNWSIGDTGKGARVVRQRLRLGPARKSKQACRLMDSTVRNMLCAKLARKSV